MYTRRFSGAAALTALRLCPPRQQLKLEWSLGSPLCAKYPEERAEGDIASPASPGTQVLPRS